MTRSITPHDDQLAIRQMKAAGQNDWKPDYAEVLTKIRAIENELNAMALLTTDRKAKSALVEARRWLEDVTNPQTVEECDQWLRIAEDVLSDSKPMLNDADMRDAITLYLPNE